MCCCFWVRLVFPGKRQLETFFSLLSQLLKKKTHFFLFNDLHAEEMKMSGC